MRTAPEFDVLDCRRPAVREWNDVMELEAAPLGATA
jgi:hypothetical protein